MTFWQPGMVTDRLDHPPSRMISRSKVLAQVWSTRWAWLETALFPAIWRGPQRGCRQEKLPGQGEGYMTTMLLCTGCGEIGEPQEDMRLYECGNCGNQWVSDEGNRCPDCNRFAAVVSTNVCQSCDSPMLEAKGDVLSCASCGAFVLEGKDCPVCAPHPYPSWNGTSLPDAGSATRPDGWATPWSSC